MSIEAMKQALEALENSIDDVRDCLNQNLPLAGYARYDQRIEWYREQITKHEDAITSLRQAIEQAEKQEPVCDTDPRGCWSVRCQLGNKCKNTPAPQREWVGLTDEEIALVCAECAASAHNWNDISFARAIEAKLKQKNGSNT